MAALASDLLRHFRLLLWNRWTEFNETWQESRSQCPLQSLCFSGRSEKQDGRPGLWLAETFSTSPLKPPNGIQRKLDWKQDLNVHYQVCVFRANRKNKMAVLASDLLRHFRLLLWNRWQNSTKLDRNQDLNVLYNVCVFRADRKNKMATLASDWLRYFRLLLWNCWTEFNETWQEERSQRPLSSLCFLGQSEKTRWVPCPIRQKGGTLYSGARYVAFCYLDIFTV